MLELRDLACERAGRLLFRGLSAQLRPGEWLYAQGANGAGKTSLLRLVCGLLTPAQGDVLWQGQSVSRMRDDFGRQLVYIGHAAALKDDLSALENLVVASELAGWAATPREARDALGQAGLGGRERTPARALSQGQRRRISLARLALAHPQRLWVLDEPFNALDTAASEWLTGLMQSQLRRGGCVVLTSHQGVALADGVEPVRVTL